MLQTLITRTKQYQGSFTYAGTYCINTSNLVV